MKIIQFNWKLVLLIVFTILFVFSFIFFTNSNLIEQLTERLDVFNYSTTKTGIERIALWDKTLRLWKENPSIGVGAGNWQLLFLKFSVEGIYSAEFDTQTFQRPHNDFLWVLSETGIIGFIFYFLFLILPIFYGLKLYLKKSFSKENLILLFYISVLSGFLIVSFFDFPRERIELMIVLHVILAIIYVRLIKTNQLIEISSIKINARVLLLITLIGIAFSVIVGIARWKGESNMNKVYTYRSAGNWKKVISHANNASSLFYTLDPTSIPITWYKALANFSMRNYSLALKDYQVAYNASPYNQYILNDLASAYEMNNDHELAKRYYQEALNISPNFDDPKLNLAAIYFNEKNYSEALEWTRKVKSNSARKQQYIKVISEKINTLTSTNNNK